jgi:hypothetical protein
MHTPLHYQVSEYDCVPTALINAVSYLFKPAVLPGACGPAGGSAHVADDLICHIDAGQRSFFIVPMD